jgi:hypothetical protein
MPRYSLQEVADIFRTSIENLAKDRDAMLHNQEELVRRIDFLGKTLDEQLAINKSFERRIKSLEQALDNGLPLY